MSSSGKTLFLPFLISQIFRLNNEDTAFLELCMLYMGFQQTELCMLYMGCQQTELCMLYMFCQQNFTVPLKPTVPYSNNLALVYSLRTAPF